MSVCFAATTGFCVHVGFPGLYHGVKSNFPSAGLMKRPSSSLHSDLPDYAKAAC